MPKHYTEAYHADGGQILGNLDGQGVIRARQPRRTNLYKTLVSGLNRPFWSRVHHWKLVTEDGKLVETINNRFYKPALPERSEI